MHEVGIVRNLVEIAEQHVISGGHTKVLSISIEIGELSNVVPEAVEFCFEAVSCDTLLEGSLLIIKRIPGRMHCCDCNQHFGVKSFTFTCPYCGSCILEIMQGDELRMIELEVE